MVKSNSNRWYLNYRVKQLFIRLWYDEKLLIRDEQWPQSSCPHLDHFTLTMTRFFCTVAKRQAMPMNHQGWRIIRSKNWMLRDNRHFLISLIIQLSLLIIRFLIPPNLCVFLYFWSLFIMCSVLFCLPLEYWVLYIFFYYLFDGSLFCKLGMGFLANLYMQRECRWVLWFLFMGLFFVSKMVNDKWGKN